MVRWIWFFGSLFDDSSGSFHYSDHPYRGAVLPVQRSYINARERLRLWWTKKKKKKKQKNNKKRDFNWWPAKCLPTVNQLLISYRYPQGNGYFFGLVFDILRKTTARAPFCKKKRGGNEKREYPGIGCSSKEAFCKQLGTHSPLCTSRTTF